MELQTRKFNSGQGVAMAALTGLIAWAGVCATIFAVVTQ